MRKAGMALLLLFAGITLLLVLRDLDPDVRQALATEAATATSDAHAVSVCVGLINAGSCTARQTSTAVATRPAAADPGPNPWPVILSASVLLMLAVGVIVGALDRLDGER